MTPTQIVVSLLIALVTICDAMRDAWVSGRRRDIGWWEWHIVKWIAFYAPLVVLCVTFLETWQMLALAILCYGLWELTYRKLS